MINEHLAKYRPELLAFRKWACEQFPNLKNHITRGTWDKGLYFQCYRAGASASAERIKVLEERVAELERRLTGGVGGEPGGPNDGSRSGHYFDNGKAMFGGRGGGGQG